MKKLFFSLALVITLILPIRTNALELTKSFETTIPNTNSMVEFIFPSYDNSGNVDGHFLYSDKVYKYNLKNELIYVKDEAWTEEKIQIETVYKADNSNVKGNSDVKISSSNFEVLYGGDGDEYIIGDDLLFKSYDVNGYHDGYIMYLLTTSTNLSGITPGYIILKVDLNGKAVWQKNTNSSAVLLYAFYEEFLYVKDKYSNEYIYTVEDFSNDGKVFINKYNYNDNPDTTEPMVSIEFENYAFSYINYSYNASGEIDGLIFASADQMVETNLAIGKYDLDLKEQFIYTIDELGLFYGIISSKNEQGIYDGYIAVSFSLNDNTLIVGTIRKLDFFGNEVWRDVYCVGDDENYLYGIEESYDETGRFNGYAVTGFIDDGQQEYATFLKYTYPSYKIINQASNEGIINVNTLAYPGDIVKVKVSPSVGYSLKRIVVMTSSGKEIEVDSNGTFVMPDEEVTVLALYNKVTNPDTVSACYIVLGIVLLISLGTLIVTKKKALE